MGAFAGFTQCTSMDKPPCKVSAVRRRIPVQTWYSDIRIQAPVCGLVIFGTIFAEFQYVLMSVWRSYMYGMLALLWFNMMLLVVVVALVSILTTYLCI